jgi:phosphatidylserine/phosphatidylglycerophosphate/cardiolipin synthase-like enzyme
MVKFLTTNMASAYIEEIIINSKEELTLVLPYLILSDTIYSRLNDAINRNVRITVVYGKNWLSDEDYGKLDKFNNLRFLYCINLHAKCYFNEEQMVITSMNLHKYSEQNNREMGILIERKEEGDRDVFEAAVSEVESIINSSDIKKDAVPTLEKKINVKNSSTINGYCIRCQKHIPVNTDKPLCRICYKTWNEFGDPIYQERYCHKCGRSESTSMAKPLCKNCYFK